MRTPDKGELTFEMNRDDNEDRLRELILYIVNKCGNDPKFGATKLNKVLFYADFFSFAHFGKAVTGVQYMKLPQGPAPKRLLPIRNDMRRRGELAVSERELFNGNKQTRFAALRDPQVSLFTASELALVDEVIDYLRDRTAEEVSEGTHGRVWRAACDRELIPYEAILVSDRRADASDTALVRKLSRKYRWKERVKREAVPA